jgi:hypothetical protein
MSKILEMEGDLTRGNLSTRPAIDPLYGNKQQLGRTAEEFKHFRKIALAVKIDKIWEFLQLPVLEWLRNLGKQIYVGHEQGVCGVQTPWIHRWVRACGYSACGIKPSI